MPFHTVIPNVPGPRTPLSLLESLPLEAASPGSRALARASGQSAQGECRQQVPTARVSTRLKPQVMDSVVVRTELITEKKPFTAQAQAI